MRGYCLVAITASFLVLASEARASENGTIAYPVGVNTIAPAALPPPDVTWLQNYTQYYTADQFTNNGGKDSKIPGFKLDVKADALRFLHSWNDRVGPFSIASGVVFTAFDAEIGTKAFPGALTKGTGIGDITIQPLYLGTASKGHTLFTYSGIDFIVPVGTFISNRFFSIIPNTNVTWLPTSRLEISGSTGIEFHTRNYKTGYHTGSIAYLDYGVNYKAFSRLKALTIGINGYGATQLSNDSQYSSTIRGKKVQAFAVGPQLTYSFAAGAIGAKWQHEVYTENRPKGDKFWVQFFIPLNKVR